mmetsp:Transcript_56961/g.152127  ORF Transcript_56961/g.152127 Transcript_56961/m.152127 type:complete len:211 (+) Transcript_56961:92-724(+)
MTESRTMSMVRCCQGCSSQHSWYTPLPGQHFTVEGSVWLKVTTHFWCAEHTGSGNSSQGSLDVATQLRAAASGSLGTTHASHEPAVPARPGRHLVQMPFRAKTSCPSPHHSEHSPSIPARANGQASQAVRFGTTPCPGGHKVQVPSVPKRPGGQSSQRVRLAACCCPGAQGSHSPSLPPVPSGHGSHSRGTGTTGRSPESQMVHKPFKQM